MHRASQLIEQEPGHLDDDVSEWYHTPFFPHAPRRPTVALPQSTIEAHRRSSFKRFATLEGLTDVVPVDIEGVSEAHASHHIKRNWSGLVTQIMTTDFPSPQESCRCVSIFFFLLSVMLLAIVFVITDRHQKTLDWAQRPWIQDSCLIVDTGLKYEGNCEASNKSDSVNMRLIRPRPQYDYTTCEEDSMCQVALTEAYNSANTRRLNIAHRFERKQVQKQPEPCYDLFIPWARVSLPKEADSNACAFRYGFGTASIYDTYSEALHAHEVLHKAHAKGEPYTCWYMTIAKEEKDAGACGAAALEDPTKWAVTQSLRAVLERILRPALWFVTGTFFTISFIAAIILCYLRHHGHDKWRHGLTSSRFFEGQQNSGIPEEGTSALDVDYHSNDERMLELCRRWDVMRNVVLEKYLPQNHEYMRLDSKRKIEVAESVDPQDSPKTNTRRSILRDTSLDGATKKNTKSRVSFSQMDTDNDGGGSDNESVGDQSMTGSLVSGLRASLSSSTRTPASCSSCSACSVINHPSDRCYVTSRSDQSGSQRALSFEVPGVD